MANIKQQKKRIRTAADERLENLRYRSTIKTLTKRLARRSTTATPTRSRRAPHARPLDRQGRLARRTAPEHRRPQEVAGRPARVAQPAPAPEPKVAASKAAPKAAGFEALVQGQVLAAPLPQEQHHRHWHEFTRVAR